MRNVCVLDRVAHMEENCGESRLTVCYCACVLLCVTVRVQQLCSRCAAGRCAPSAGSCSADSGNSHS